MPEDRSKEKEPSSKDNQSIRKKKSGQGGDPLPWWIELLFVQIGLPDNWLRIYLRQKKQLKLISCSNKKLAGATFIGLLAFLYVNPIIKNASNANNCNISSIEYIKDNVALGDSLTKKELQAWSTRFCNGGDLY